MANEIVGTLLCKECKEIASVLQTKRGKGTYLYRRCGCGCDQRTGAAIQKRWATDMTPKAGFEHLKLEPTEPEPTQQPETAKPVPEAMPTAKPVPQVKGAGFMPVFGALCGLGLLLLTAGKSGGMS
jgi:hypothetical protein